MLVLAFISILLKLKTIHMKTQKDNKIETLIKKFDKQLAELLMEDIKSMKLKSA